MIIHFVILYYTTNVLQKGCHMSAINSVFSSVSNPALNDQESESFVLKLINGNSLDESKIDQAMQVASNIKSSDVAQAMFSHICNAYLKLQTESGCEKAYEAAKLKLKEQDHEEAYQIYTSVIVESCKRLKTAHSMKLAEKIYNENSDWLKYLSKVDSTHSSSQICQNQQIHSNSVENVKNISQLSEDEIKEMIFKQIESGNAHELNEAFLGLDSKQKVKLFSSSMSYSTDWVQGEENMNPLQYACFLGNVEVVKVLLDHGAPVNDADSMYNLSTNRGSIHCALDAGHSQVALLLLERGAKNQLASCTATHGRVSYRLPTEYLYSWTCLYALHMAIVKNMPEVVEKLLTVCTDEIKKRASGYTSCLHLAARDGNETILTLLLSHGAKELLGSKDSFGKTPMDLAIAAKHENLAKLLTP